MLLMKLTTLKCVQHSPRNSTSFIPGGWRSRSQIGQSSLFMLLSKNFPTVPDVDWPHFEVHQTWWFIELSDCVFPIRCDDGSRSPDSAISKWSELFLSGTGRLDVPWIVRNIIRIGWPELDISTLWRIFTSCRWIYGQKTRSSRSWVCFGGFGWVVADDFRNVDLREPDVGTFGYFHGSLHPSSGNDTRREETEA